MNATKSEMKKHMTGELITAAQFGDPDRVAHALQHGADPLAVGPYGKSVLDICLAEARGFDSLSDNLSITAGRAECAKLIEEAIAAGQA